MSKGLVEIKFDSKKLRQIQSMLSSYPRALPKVMSRAINRTASSARTQTARKISEIVRLKVSTIRKRVSLEKASYTRWIATLGISGYRIPLINFGAKQTRTGVSYTIDKKSGRKKLAHAFVATMSSGHKGVFKRKGEDRLPIVELYGPSLGVIFEGASGLAAEITHDAYRELGKNIDQQVALILKRARVAA